MVKLVIIADDFTGALDTGVQFSKNAINTLVVLYKDLDFSKTDNIEVVVVDTESRHVSKEEAALRVKEIGMKAVRHGVSYFYKKTDSVLRGNIGSELYALMEGIDSKEIMFIPAYPDAKRTTVDGSQFVDGVPIDETSFARDPLDPVRYRYIPALINFQVDADVIVVKRGMLDSICLPDNDNKTIYVFDAEVNRDLSEIALFLMKNQKLRLTAGCAGFANTLLDVFDLKKSHRTKKERAYSNMLAVCGSLNELSLRQVKYAESNNFYSVTLNPEQKLQQSSFKAENGDILADKLVQMLDEGKNVIIKTIDGLEDEENCKKYARELHIDERLIPFLISQNIANLINEIAARRNLETLVVFGGDTTVEIVNALGLDGVAPKEEIMTGVVLSETIGKGMNINLVTKSGGFGEENVLVKIKEYLSSLGDVSI